MEKNNIKILSRQTDVSKFYNKATVVLNLSDKRQFVETFGLTALETMSAGLPVIVPTEGGIAEMVKDGVNGYKIDVQELDKIADKIERMMTNRDLYQALSTEALNLSTRFGKQSMIEEIEKIISRK